jgi:hypothetical protein
MVPGILTKKTRITRIRGPARTVFAAHILAIVVREKITRRASLRRMGNLY